MHSFYINRRRFLKTGAASLAMSMFGPAALESVFQTQPRRVGLIGSGWYGKSDLFRLIQVTPVEVVAVCDVDKNHVQGAAELISKRQKSGNTPRTYENYQTMLANHEFDIILIGTPDHWHALQCIDALKAGAHVFVQKPISVDVQEGEAMLAAARKYNKVVQVGTQRRSTPHLVEAKKRFVDTGMLGDVAHVELCCYYHMRNRANPDVKPVPDFLNYDLWTGPAPLRPYDNLPHRGWWRAFMEYSNGIMGDMCIHMFDAARWMLNKGWPDKVISTGGILVQTESKSNTPDTQTAIFEYDDMNMVWQHRTWGRAADPDYPWAFKIYGDKGTLEASVRGFDFIPQGDGETIHQDVVIDRTNFPEDLTEDSIELFAAPAMRAHMMDFIHAIDHGSRPVADIEEGHISTASCILANMSLELGRPLVYDPVTRTVPGDAEATEKLARAYRNPYQHPDPSKV